MIIQFDSSKRKFDIRIIVHCDHCENNKFLISFLKNHILVSKMEPNELVEKSGDLFEEAINNNKIQFVFTFSHPNNGY